ncbi:valine--tRNA ligase, mitochondrial 1-like isoform X3 [Nicotiana tomentosiformis]|uniref:valine--tRNA ligase, mitochondrial 1-like isoform X3 n=1 Tax=Nicotiana tomentosiformis TaxID=4098 RepID=UPI00051B1FCC|nr:valine--tRNA ligase, mitochondrial 1-like isoform X1 [Nicotiana tomentosiformis]XP_018623551.1 valine--tRNA ligase, mitochondrial 1-like isoform X1 [Nicotiana tomentosiformis]
MRHCIFTSTADTMMVAAAATSDGKELTLEDFEKKKKKEEKAREKELKKLKAALKVEAAKQAQAASNVSKKDKKKNSKMEGEEENYEDFVDPGTPLGEKKQLSRQMAKTYSPSAVEKSWYAWWEKSNFFVADPNSSKPAFVIVLPPPNVTGALHIGHALTAAIQDTIIRWRRMSGYNALWIPGMDHAGIATQVVVEKKIMRERNLTRHDIGRENFVSEVWNWKNEYGGTILKQLRRLGASLDWSRECFTMDEKRSKAVTEAFVRLSNEGLIYRAPRMVHWDCVLRTAISDIEVEYTDIKKKTHLKVPGYEEPVEFGVLTSFAYPLEGGLGEIVVATTRIETMLGDTAIAIHPEDKRYCHLHGKFAIHPFNGRKLPIVCDEILVDMNFGTGAVKITPAHDPNDFEFGQRHKLEFINIFTDDGKINSNGGADFEGMPRFKARVAVAEALKEKGLYRDVKDNEMRLGICSRSNDVVEPLVKPQWFVNCKSMAKQALDAVMDDDNRKMEIIPKQYAAEWKRWLDNIRDWCISRQLWWGHRIPAWYVTLHDDKQKEFGVCDDHWIVARNAEEARDLACRKFPGKAILELSQDPDVLDTWFSSGLFPLSALGWPDDTADLKVFYPTSVIETGHDILFFWVARMVMLAITLGGDVPFMKVYLHPMIRDAQGRKMSKSLGNVVDPLEVINGITLDNLHDRLKEGNLDAKEIESAKEGQAKDFPKGIPECGADALRFALVSYTAQSDKINLDIQRVVGYRQWCNKLWNAVRFALSKLGEYYMPPTNIVPREMPFICQWILSALNKAIAKTVSSLESYDFSDAATAVYSFWQFQLCDVFIEVIKPYFVGDNPEFVSARRFAQDTLWLCLDNGLRLLHPFMPFISEELWQRLPASGNSIKKESIVISDYPATIEGWNNDWVEAGMEKVLSIVKGLRSKRALLPPKERFARRKAFVLCWADDNVEFIRSRKMEICTLAALSSLQVSSNGDTAPTEWLIEVVDESVTVFLEGEGTTCDPVAEIQRLIKKRKDTRKQYENLNKMMSASRYKEKVPLNIQEDNTVKLCVLRQELESFEDNIRRFTPHIDPRVLKLLERTHSARLEAQERESFEGPSTSL